MKTIEIQAQSFFDMLRANDKSMWEIFAHMISGEEMEVVFLNEQQQMMFSFILPETLEELAEVQQEFHEKFKEKIRSMLN